MQSRWTRLTAMMLLCAAPLAVRAQTTAKPTTEQRTAEQQTTRQQTTEQQATDQQTIGQEPAPVPPRVQVHGENRQIRPASGGDRSTPGAEAPSGSDAADDRVSPIDATTSEELNRSDAFFKEHAPNRWALLQSIEEDRQQSPRGYVLLRFRALERLKNNDPEMYQLQLKRFAVEDEIVGIRFASRQERRWPTPEELSTLRGKVELLMDLSLEERELRVQRLREMLKREESYLASERGGREAAINERLSIIEQGRGMGMGRRRDVEGDGADMPPPPPNDQPSPSPR